MSGYATFHDLKDASVFITGGGAGIGAALTEGFLAQGCQVAFVQRSDAHQFAARMGKKYERAPLFLQCDITNVAALQKAMQRASKAHGPCLLYTSPSPRDS